MTTKQPVAHGPDDLDTLSTIWILACVDKNPLVTYEGLVYRLGVPDRDWIKALVKKHGELFRTTGSATALETWKLAMLQNTRQPHWVVSIEDDAERRAKINSLTTDDVFRSQFRVADPSRSAIEIIDWGLQHIERLRKARVEAREERAKKWAVIWIPLITSFLGLIVLLSGVYVQVANTRTQKDLQMLSLDIQKKLKYYEVELKPKQDGYSSMMKHLEEAYEGAQAGNTQSMKAALNQLELTYLSVEPFLLTDKFDVRENVKAKIGGLSEACQRMADPSRCPPGTAVCEEEYRKKRDEFQGTLFRALFPPE